MHEKVLCLTHALGYRAVEAYNHIRHVADTRGTSLIKIIFFGGIIVFPSQLFLLLQPTSIRTKCLHAKTSV